MKPAAVQKIARLMRDASRHRDTYAVFADVCEMMAIALARMDLRQFETREARYLELERRHGREFRDMGAAVLAELVNALEVEPFDVLGAVFHELELHNKHVGQFFAPYELCRMLARMTGGPDEWRAIIAARGHITVSEPAAGAGAMMIALAHEMQLAGVNYQKHMHVTAVDVDSRAAHMAFVQLSLLHVPARVIVGNTLTLVERECWLTPAHVMGGWSRRLAVAADERAASASVASVERIESRERAAPRIEVMGDQFALF